MESRNTTLSITPTLAIASAATADGAAVILAAVRARA